MNLISFLSDFGLKDGYVGCVKGVILSINPDACILDLAHDITPFNIEEAAYILENHYDYFPKGTIHLAVVDPGVGSKRIPVIIKTAKYYFVGPDNGIFSFIIQSEAYTAYKINLEKLLQLLNIKREMSSTFHTRDIFGPVAALLTKGISVEKLSSNLSNQLLLLTDQIYVTNNMVHAKIINIDRFGNLITNFSQKKHGDLSSRGIQEITIKDKTIKSVHTKYSDVRKNDFLAFWGSTGLLEISINKGSAEKKLGCIAGKDEVRILLSTE
jgi:S-adenosylmethionine hydrolase